MNKTRPLVVAGIIFSVMAVMHLLRLLYHWEVVIAGLIIPMWVSVLALIVGGILAIWLFVAASRK